MSKCTTCSCIGTVHGHTTLPGTSSLDLTFVCQEFESASNEAVQKRQNQDGGTDQNENRVGVFFPCRWDFDLKMTRHKGIITAVCQTHISSSTRSVRLTERLSP